VGLLGTGGCQEVDVQVNVEGALALLVLHQVEQDVWMVPHLQESDGEELERVGGPVVVQELLDKLPVQGPLDRGHADEQHVLLLPREGRPNSRQSSPLHESLEQAVQHVCPEAHELPVLGGAVQALSVLDGALKHVAELRPGAQVRGTHKVHHAPVLQQVVLQRVARQHNASPAHKDTLALSGASVAVLDAVSLVADHQVWAGVHQGLVYV
ncbi:unnamed protein product, partial [Ixodes hexagonus]